MAIPVLLFVVAVAVRAVSALVFAEAAYPDAYYYATVAKSLAAGRGFEVDYIWNFVEVGGRLPHEGLLPIPSNAHWMPLAAVVQVPFLWFFGVSPFAAGAAFWIASGLTASLTWFIGRDAGMTSWQSAAAGLLVAVPGGVAPFLGQPDNFAVFMLLGALSLWLCSRSLRGDRRAFAMGGLVVGLAFLARTDGVLLGLPFAIAAARDVLVRPRLSRLGAMPIILCLAGFLLLAAPWLWRQLEVFGSLSPSAANGRILWISLYEQLYSVSSDTSLASFLDQGLAAILWSRLGGLAFALILFAALPLLFILVPFLLVGVAARGRHRHFGPWVTYAVALFVFSAIVSAVHIPHGTFMHSAVALLPHAYLLVLVGLAVTIAVVGRRRAGWDIPRATRTISAMVVAIAIVGGAVATLVTMREWAAERDARAPLLVALADMASPGDRVMSADAGAYHYQGGWPGIVTPEDPLPVVEEALRRYDVRWLALESSHIVRSLGPLLTGDTRPAWLSEPLLLVEPVDAAEQGNGEGPGPPPGPGPPEATSAVPRGALFAVCLDEADRRCAP